MKTSERNIIRNLSSSNHYLLSLSRYDLTQKKSHFFRINNLSETSWDFKKKIYPVKFLVLPFKGLRLSKVNSDDS